LSNRAPSQWHWIIINGQWEAGITIRLKDEEIEGFDCMGYASTAVKVLRAKCTAIDHVNLKLLKDYKTPDERSGFNIELDARDYPRNQEKRIIRWELK